jgi:aerobic C4-dicarboxylate transport protein
MSYAQELTAGLPGDTRPRRRPFYADPSFLVFAAMLIGVMLGYFQPLIAENMKPLGDIFLRLIRMAIGPVIFLTVVTGVVGAGDMKRVGRVGGLALLYFEITTTVALGIGLIVANVVRPGDGFNAKVTGASSTEVAQYVSAGEKHGFGDFLLNIVPDNILRAFVDGQLIQIVFFSLVFGFALSALGSAGKPIEDLLHKFSAVFFRIIDLVMRFAPVGAFGALAFTIGKYGIAAAGTLGYFVLCVYGGYVFFVAVVLGAIARIAGVNLWRLIAYLKEELLIVLGTSTTESVLLPTMEKMEQLGCPRAVVGLVLPTGYSFNLDGAAIYLSIATMFIAQAYNIDLDLWQQLVILLTLVITSKGGAGVAGAAFVVLAATLSASHVLPVEGLALLFGVDRIVNIGRAVVNLICNAVATLIVAKMDGSFDQAKGVATGVIVQSVPKPARSAGPKTY